jgi:outer membrane lipoprotein-sorting protein
MLSPKKLSMLFLGLLLCLCSYAQELTEASAVVDRYLIAVGGLEKLRGIQDMTVNMTADIQGRALEMETKLKMPNKFRQASYMMGNEAGGTVYDGTTLSRSMRGQQTTKQGQEAFQEFLQNHPFPELYYDTLNVEKKLVGIEKVGDKDAYKVAYTANGTTWYDYFDKQTGLKVMRSATMDTPRGKSEVRINFGDYKSVGGILFPHSRSQKMGQFEMNMETSSIKLNKGIDDKHFKIK